MSVQFELLGFACTDCVMAIANDDFTGMNDATETAVREGLERIGQWLYVGEDMGFMRCGCDVCLCPLAGDKHRVLVEVSA